MLRTFFINGLYHKKNFKYFHTSTLVRLKEYILEKKDANTTVIQARKYESPRTPYLLNFDKKANKCALCQLNLNLKHTDVLILSQFTNSVGEIMPRRITGLCKDQYKLVRELIFMAQYAGLLPEPPSSKVKKPYELLNTYFDETTINLRPVRKVYANKLYYLKLNAIEKLRVKPNNFLY